MSALSLSSSEQILYDYMMGFVGIPYRYGGDVPADGGIDCSGLVLLYLQAAGKWPHGQDASAQGIFDGLRVKGHALFKPGDDYFPMAFGHLAIYGSEATDVGHIALVLDHLLMLEAGGGDSTTTTPAAAAARNAIVRIRPTFYRKDFLGVLRP